MSDEPKNSPGKRFNWPAAHCVIIAIAAYEGAHYATAGYELRDSMWVFSNHRIGGETAPDWIERFFWPAARIDDMLGFQPLD
jgi:hypothetical protein